MHSGFALLLFNQQLFVGLHLCTDLHSGTSFLLAATKRAAPTPHTNARIGLGSSLNLEYNSGPSGLKLMSSTHPEVWHAASVYFHAAFAHFYMCDLFFVPLMWLSAGRFWFMPLKNSTESICFNVLGVWLNFKWRNSDSCRWDFMSYVVNLFFYCLRICETNPGFLR